MLVWESFKGVQDVWSCLPFDGFEWSFTADTEVIHYVLFRTVNAHAFVFASLCLSEVF